jgi:hypothetical protein
MSAVHRGTPQPREEVMRTILAALVSTILVAPAVMAATWSIIGTKLIVVDRVAKASKAKVVFVSKDAAIYMIPSQGLPIDARLDIAYDDVQGTWTMPAGDQWTIVPYPPTGIAKYVNKEAPVGGSVKVSTIKDGLLLKVVGKNLGDEPIDISQPPSGPVYVAHTVHDGPNTWRHCTQFLGCVHRVIAGGSGYKLVCRGGSAYDPTCAAAPVTTTTTLPPCPVPPEAGWTCCQGAPLLATCSVEYRTTGDAETFCTNIGGGVPVPGRCGAPACAAQGCCLDTLFPSIGACADVGIDGTADEVASTAVTCTALGGTWSAGPCP